MLDTLFKISKDLYEPMPERSQDWWIEQSISEFDLAYAPDRDPENQRYKDGYVTIEEFKSLTEGERTPYGVQIILDYLTKFCNDGRLYSVPALAVYTSYVEKLNSSTEVTRGRAMYIAWSIAIETERLADGPLTLRKAQHLGSGFGPDGWPSDSAISAMAGKYVSILEDGTLWTVEGLKNFNATKVMQ